MTVLRLTGGQGHTAADLARMDVETDRLVDAIIDLPGHLAPSVMLSTIITVLMMTDKPQEHWASFKAMVDDGIGKALAIGDVEGSA